MGVGFYFVPELELFGLCIRKEKKITTIVSENRLTGEKETYEVLSSLAQPIKKVFSISGTTIYDGDIFINQDGTYSFIQYLGKGCVAVLKVESVEFYDECRKNSISFEWFDIKRDAKAIAKYFSNTILFCNTYEVKDETSKLFNSVAINMYNDIFVKGNKDSRYLKDDE